MSSFGNRESLNIGRVKSVKQGGIKDLDWLVPSLRMTALYWRRMKAIKQGWIYFHCYCLSLIISMTNLKSNKPPRCHERSCDDARRSPEPKHVLRSREGYLREWCELTARTGMELTYFWMEILKYSTILYTKDVQMVNISFKHFFRSHLGAIMIKV
jgi:hypothetical protein